MEAVRYYVEHGGLWVECGGYSFFYQFYPKVEASEVVGWKYQVVGDAGLKVLGKRCAMLPLEEPAMELFLTDSDKKWLGAGFDKQLLGRRRLIVGWWRMITIWPGLAQKMVLMFWGIG